MAKKDLELASLKDQLSQSEARLTEQVRRVAAHVVSYMYIPVVSNLT